MVIAYTVSDDVGIQNAYAELAAANYGLLSFGVLEFTSLNPGEEYIVKFTADDTDFNTTSREEYFFIQDFAEPFYIMLL